MGKEAARNKNKVRERSIASVILSLTLLALPAYAQEDAATTSAATAMTSSPSVSEALARPAALKVLYVSYGALQAYDVYSTREGLARGAREANPLMRGVVGNTGAFVALKAGVAVATITAAEKLWKTNKPAAIGLMIAGNSVAAIVAANNTRTLGKLR